jgi:hypothetical protein
MKGDPDLAKRLENIEMAIKELAATVDNILELFSRTNEKTIEEDRPVQGLFNRAQDRITRIERDLNKP